MLPTETRNNYLILTPDGVGSTYLARALTVYLQSVDLDYWNTNDTIRFRYYRWQSIQWGLSW